MSSEICGFSKVRRGRSISRQDCKRVQSKKITKEGDEMVKTGVW
jgi:hypothetical protein